MYLFWLWLALLPQMSDRDKLHMLRLAGNPEDLYHADRNALLALSPAEKRWAPLLNKSLDAAQKIQKQCDTLGIRVLPLNHSEYPSLLRVIPDPPLVLYCKGRLPDLSQVPLVGVVGTRNCSDYGIAVARDLGMGLGLHGAGVISGMAAGIDGAATEGSLQAGAPTVGVLGCGLDIIYPKSNASLYARMEQQGCLISEFPPGTPAAGRNFPKRNRIISGLSVAVAVVEAPERSGALITARLALEQGRDVFAVPGATNNPLCAGSNQLLHDGACTVTCPWDILEGQTCRYPCLQEHPSKKPVQAPPSEPTEIQTSKEPRPRPLPRDLNPQEQAVYGALEPKDVHINTVAARTGLDTSAIMAALTLLELKGHVTVRPGGWARTI